VQKVKTTMFFVKAGNKKIIISLQQEIKKKTEHAKL